MSFPMAQEVNLPACSPHCLFNAERASSREAVNTNFKVIGLTRLGIKPKSTASEADAFTTRPSELNVGFLYVRCHFFGLYVRAVFVLSLGFHS